MVTTLMNMERYCSTSNRVDARLVGGGKRKNALLEMRLLVYIIKGRKDGY